MKENKKALRQTVKEFIALQNAQNRIKYGDKMADILLASPLWKSAKSVFCFYSLPSECSTEKILSAAIAQNKILCLPKCEKDGVMHAYCLRSLEDTVIGAYNIPEPKGNEIISPTDIELCILPCYAASLNGARLGKGGGYYDRFLSEFRGNTVIMCQDELIFENGVIPMEKHDIYAQYILTQTKLIKAKK